MQVDQSIFRAYDIRGIVNKHLNEKVVKKVGQSIAALYPEAHQVAVGYDGRLSSESLATALCEGLCESGVDVVNMGQIPTPVLYYSAYKYCEGSGLMITGSHNPAEYNGIKMMIQGHTLAGDDIQAIYHTIHKNQFSTADKKGVICSTEVEAEYIERIKEDVTLKKPLKIAIDCGNGVAGPIAKNLFTSLGCEVIDLYCDVDGRFPNHHPNPSDVKNIQELRDVVVQQKADIGLAFDGDGDRLGVIDNEGEVIWADRQMMIYARDILKDNKGAAIVFDVKSSSYLPKLIKQYGGTPYMSRTGHSYIKAMLKEKSALLAGEMSGHIFFNDKWYGFDDALYAGARLLQIVIEDGRSTSEIFSELLNTHSTPEITIWFDVEDMQYEFMQRFVNKASFPSGTISTIDGIRVDFDDSWGLVRASNTTPCLVLRFEGDSEEALNAVKALFKKQLVAVQPDIELPF